MIRVTGQAQINLPLPQLQSKQKQQNASQRSEGSGNSSNDSRVATGGTRKRECGDADGLLFQHAGHTHFRDWKICPRRATPPLLSPFVAPHSRINTVKHMRASPRFIVAYVCVCVCALGVRVSSLLQPLVCETFFFSNVLRGPFSTQIQLRILCWIVFRSKKRNKRKISSGNAIFYM